MIRVSMDGAAFRKLVRGEVVDLTGYDAGSRAGPDRGVPVQIALADIGFGVMVAAIEEAIKASKARGES